MCSSLACVKIRLYKFVYRYLILNLQRNETLNEVQSVTIRTVCVVVVVVVVVVVLIKSAHPSLSRVGSE